MSTRSQNDSRLSIGALSTRYGIGRSAVYTRMKALGIHPAKVGNRAYVTADQVALLDELHNHIQAGGITAVFLQEKGLHFDDGSLPAHSQPGQSVELSSGLVLNQSDVWKLARAITAEITALFKKSG